jgi:hypothetical protein
MQITYNTVICLGKKRRVFVVIDYKNIFCAFASNQMLDSAADAAGDVKLQRDPVAG